MTQQSKKLHEVIAVVEIVVGALSKKNARAEAKTELSKLSENLCVIEIGGARDYAKSIGADLDVIGTSKVPYLVRALVALSLYAASDRAAKKTATTELEKLQLQNVTIRTVRTPK